MRRGTTRRIQVGLGAMALGVGALGVAAGAVVHAQAPHGGGHGAHSPQPTDSPTAPEAAGGRQPRRVTMEELHRAGGVPRGWQFAVPPGEVAKGRRLFQDLECYKCHAVRGESFPPAGGDPKSVGPDLTGMGAMHPAEYFAESILAPNHVILEGTGFTGPDGLSIMPSFADSLSLAQWLDLVAYLTSLTAGGEAPHHGQEVERSQVAGDYRIRLIYEAGAGAAHGGGHSDGHGASARPTGARGHLMAFIMDREFNEPVPYLPVTATVHTPGHPPRTVKLSPMVSDRGFHYGASLVFPEGPRKIALSIGATTMQVSGGATGRFKKPVTAVFE